MKRNLKYLKRCAASCCTLALVVAILTGCNNTAPQETPIPSPSDTGTPVAPSSGEPDEEPTPTPWQPPAITVETIKADPTQTGDFVIYSPPFTVWMNPIIDRYKELYPNVNVITESFSDNDAYNTRVTTELAAGKGSDIIFPTSMYASDINKLVNSGAFLDLNGLIEQDADFDFDDYIKSVLDGALHNGKRYVIQHSYEVPSFIASTKALDEIGFDRSQTGDIVSFLNEVVRCLPKAQENPKFKSMFNNTLWNWLFRIYGVDLVDFETNTVLPDEEGLREILEAYKPLYHIEADESRYVKTLPAQQLFDGTVIFRYGAYIGNVIKAASELKTIDDYEIFVIPGIDEKKCAMSFFNTIAINSGSQNQQNAWNFIKLMLSPEVQGNSFSSSGPVLKDSIIAQGEHLRNYYDGAIEGAVYTKLSEEEKQACLDIFMNVDDCYTYDSRPIFRMFNKHMEPYLKDEISYEDALAKLRNDLTLYVSE